MTDPILRRKFQMFDIHDNHNKEWLVELWADGTAKTSYARTGRTPQETHFTGWDEYAVNRKIDEKLRKGYKEIILHKPTTIIQATNEVVDAEIEQLVHWIFLEAGESIAHTLATSVDALSVDQINKGRKLLKDFQDQKRFPVTVVEEYYGTIPTQMETKIDAHELTKNFDPAHEETRLDQLEAALSTYTAVVAGSSQYTALGAQIKKLAFNSDAHKSVMDYLMHTAANYYKNAQVFSVKIPGERSAFDANPRGKHNVVSLWHGTRNPNVRHILKGGLRVPQMNGHVSNGSRFGLGIYFADKARRSMGYTGSSRGVPKMLFVADVALGTPIQLPGDGGSNFKIPAGYDSVQGVQSYSGMDEFVVQDARQQTVRFIVTYD